MNWLTSPTLPHIDSPEWKADYLLSAFAHTFGTFFGELSSDTKALIGRETPELIKSNNEILIPGIENVYRQVLRRLEELNIPVFRQK